MRILHNYPSLARYAFWLSVFSFNLLCASEAAERFGASSYQQPENISGHPVPALMVANGVTGGLVVHLGCGDGELTENLCLGDSYLVQGLDENPKKIQLVRERLLSGKNYGKITAMTLEGNKLPYAEAMVNCLIVADANGIERSEMRRVITPGGILIESVGGNWQVTRMPGNAKQDDWTHWLHDTDGNPVSTDKEVGPPRRLRWEAGPLWARSHEFNSSMGTMVSADGRIYYIYDEGKISFETQVPDNWTLICRDAYNGLLQWKRKLPTWGMHQWKSTGLRGLTPSLRRRLVANGDKIYVSLDFNGPVYELDGATGEELRVFAHTKGAQDILIKGDILISQCNLSKGKVQAIIRTDLSSGKRLWSYKTERVEGNTLAFLNDHLVYHTGKEIVCLGMDDGKLKWRSEDAITTIDRKGIGFLITGSHVVRSGVREVRAFKLKDGTIAWETPGGNFGMRPMDVFFIDNKIWHSTKKGVDSYEINSGETASSIDPKSVFSEGHHLRCYRAKATEDWLITAYRGLEFLSTTGEENAHHDWTRGSCSYGIMPANGLVYAPPHPCFCYGGAMKIAFNAYSGATDEELDISPMLSNSVLIKGPAYETMGYSRDLSATKSDWPTYRHDQRRTGSTEETLSGKPSLKWEQSFGGDLTPPVAVKGMLYLANKDTHTLHALHASSGKPAWHYVADGAIDSPPAYYKGSLIFGTSTGTLYCLDAKSGALSWKRQIAPEYRLIVAQGRLESVWRAHGNPVIMDGVAYLTVGRSTFLDGGMFIYAVDIQSGEVRDYYKFNTVSNVRTDMEDDEFLPAYNIEGAHSDLLVSQNGRIYLNQHTFTADLNRIEPTYLTEEDVKGNRQMEMTGADYIDPGMYDLKWRDASYPNMDLHASHGVLRGKMGEYPVDLHLFTKSGFLDNNFFNRTYWMYSKIWPGFQHAQVASKAGNLVVVDEDTVYSLKLYNSKAINSPMYSNKGKGFLIVADDVENEPILDERAFARDKGLGFSRADAPKWHLWTNVYVRSMVATQGKLVACGARIPDSKELFFKTFSDTGESRLVAWSTDTGESLFDLPVQGRPIFDGMICADNTLFLVTEEGKVMAYRK